MAGLFNYKGVNITNIFYGLFHINTTNINNFRYIQNFKIQYNLDGYVLNLDYFTINIHSVYSPTSANGNIKLSVTPLSQNSYSTELAAYTTYNFIANPVGYKNASIDFSQLYSPNMFWDYFGNPTTNNITTALNSIITKYTITTSVIPDNLITNTFFYKLNIPSGCSKIYYILIGGGGTSGYGNGSSQTWGSPGGSGAFSYGFINIVNQIDIYYHVGGCQDIFGINTNTVNADGTILCICPKSEKTVLLCLSAGSGTNGQINQGNSGITGGVGGSFTSYIPTTNYSSYFTNTNTPTNGTQSTNGDFAICPYYTSTIKYPGQPNKTTSTYYGAGSCRANNGHDQSSYGLGKGSDSGGNKQTGGYIQFWFLF
jgi:hypothetical protein